MWGRKGPVSIAGFHDLKGANIQRRARRSGKLILSERPQEGYSPARTCILGPLPHTEGCKHQSTLILSAATDPQLRGGREGEESEACPHGTEQKQRKGK